MPCRLSFAAASSRSTSVGSRKSLTRSWASVAPLFTFRRLGARCEGASNPRNSYGAIAPLLTEYAICKKAHRAMVAPQIATMRQGDNRNASIEALSQNKAAEMMNVSRRSGGQRLGGLRSCRDTAR